MNKHHSDWLIVGAGPGGYELAAGLAVAGKKVTLIEKGQLGGTCLNRGCIPTKCLCATASAIEGIRRAGEFGVTVDGWSLDYARAHARAMEVVGQLREDIGTLLKDVEIVHGVARFAGNRTVEAAGDIYEADKVVIATGSRPAPLRCPGAERAIDSDRLLALEALPEGPVVIVGGGVIGLEFASVLNAFGLQVVVVEFCKEVLPGQDPELAKRLRQKLGRAGVDIRVSTAVEEIREGSVLCSGKKGLTEIPAATVIAAVGRRPVVPEGLEHTEIKLTPRGFIEVDPATMETAAAGVYAIGDVNGLCMLAHAASAQGRRVAGGKVNLDVIPAVVFTRPEFASVGAVEGPASVKVPYGANGKALAEGEADGVVKLVYDPADGRLLGCHVLGAHAADLVAEAALAIASGLSCSDFRATVHAHPTLSELLVAAAEGCNA